MNYWKTIKTGSEIYETYDIFIISSVRSSNSHPDLLVITTTTTTPLFQITPVLDKNSGLSLSEPLQLYHKQSLDSYAGYMYTICAR